MRFYMQSFYTKHMNTKHASTHSADQPVPPKRNSPLFNQSLEKGLAVIRAFSTAHRSMTMGDVAEAIHISRFPDVRVPGSGAVHCACTWGGRYRCPVFQIGRAHV